VQADTDSGTNRHLLIFLTNVRFQGGGQNLTDENNSPTTSYSIPQSYVYVKWFGWCVGRCFWAVGALRFWGVMLWNVMGITFDM
jgi:hypothetical protein